MLLAFWGGAFGAGPAGTLLGWAGWMGFVAVGVGDVGVGALMIPDT